MSSAPRRKIQLVVSLLVGLFVAWLLYAGGLPMIPDARAFSHVRVDGVVLFVLLILVVLLLRTARWYFLLAPIARVPLSTVLTVAFIGLGALTLFPLRTGELVRPLLLPRRAEISAWAAAGSIGAERVIDGLFLSAYFFVALQLAAPLGSVSEHIAELPIPVAAVHRAAYVALFVFACAFLAMGLFYVRRHWARRLVERVVGVVSLPLAQRVAGSIEAVAEGLRFLPQARYALPFLVCTALYWAANASSVYVLLHATGFDDAGFVHAMSILGILALGLLTPTAPGLFGTFQLSLYAGLSMFYASERVTREGAAFVFLFYVLQLGLTCVLAAGALIVDRSAQRRAITPR